MEPRATTHEREITHEVRLCTPAGTLDPGAIGFSRRPLHRANLVGRPGRKKRWDYWCVTSRECALQVTFADLDYLGLATVALVDLATGNVLEEGGLVPLARGFSQPETVGGADIVFTRGRLALSIREREGGTSLSASFQKRGATRLRAEVSIRRPPGHETLNVVIPWDARHFQFTSKQNTLPAEGFVEVGARRYSFGPDTGAFATLDYGRGVWPYATTWNWASASGVQDGRTVGLQLGGKWTDGTGMTENGICVDGRLHKIGEDLVFHYDRRDFRRPWRIEAPRSRCVDLTFEPLHLRRLHVPLLVAGADLSHAFGHFRGTVYTSEGEAIRIQDMLGWAEEMRARW
jgi:hypothetical protein